MPYNEPSSLPSRYQICVILSWRHNDFETPQDETDPCVDPLGPESCYATAVLPPQRYCRGFSGHCTSVSELRTCLSISGSTFAKHLAAHRVQPVSRVGKHVHHKMNALMWDFKQPLPDQTHM